MKVRWTKLAQQDLKLVEAYISRDNKTAALKVVTRIYNAVHTQLVTAPQSGRLGCIEKTRELVLTDIPYIIAYQVSEVEIRVVRVLHTSLRWPESF
jgi:addiction module RelE/StbE family toxin